MRQPLTPCPSRACRAMTHSVLQGPGYSTSKSADAQMLKARGAAPTVCHARLQLLQLQLLQEERRLARPLPAVEAFLQ